MNCLNSSRTHMPSFDDSCVLCSSNALEYYWHDVKRVYWQCRQCDLVQVPKPYHLSAVREKAEYDLHENRFDDKGYRQFLMRCAKPLLDRLPNSTTGLDFGCGPTPLLARILTERGHQVCCYDTFYFNQPAVWERYYDFITATEVVEHLSEPGIIFERLLGCLNSKGYLAVMTKRVLSKTAFVHWHYKNDPTHISFFSEKSFEYIAGTYSLSLEILEKDVVLFYKS